jgi:hypothetical protein
MGILLRESAPDQASADTMNCPGAVTAIIPAQVHRHLLSTVASGISLAFIKAEGGAQGAGMTGTQGIGVNTPSAAAVAATTSGFVGLLHIANGSTFTRGIISMIVAVAKASFTTGFPGISVATNRLGAAPKLQVSAHPVVRSSGMRDPLIGGGSTSRSAYHT